jgi:hypothetical protein
MSNMLGIDIDSNLIIALFYIITGIYLIVIGIKQWQ